MDQYKKPNNEIATALQDPMKSEAWPLCWKCKKKSKIPQIEMDQNQKCQKLRGIEFNNKQQIIWKN